MSKVKEYSKRIMCILSAGMFFFMALFYPLESFKADMSSSPGVNYNKTVSWNVSYSDLDVSDSNIVKVPTQVDLGQYEINDLYTYFYFGVSSYPLLVTESEYFAYRFSFVESNTYLNGSNIFKRFYNIGSYDELWFLEGINSIYGEQWYVTDFSNNQQLYITPIFLLYEYHIEDSAGAFDFINASIEFRTSFSVNITGYTLEDLSDEIYSVLQNIYANDTQMLSKLNQIYSSVDTVEAKLQSFVNIAEQIESNIDEIEGLLKTCNSYLSSIQSELEEQTSWLQKIYNAIIEYFGMQGDDSVDEMPSDDMDNMLNIESELLGDASASDLQNDLNVSIDADSGSFVWNLIDRLITSNSVVFGGFISVLSLGVVALILGR